MCLWLNPKLTLFFSFSILLALICVGNLFKKFCMIITFFSFRTPENRKKRRRKKKEHTKSLLTDVD